MRIGIFGGTFDPPHFGHLRAAELARESFSLDEVWFMVSNDPPHKKTRPKSPVEKRFEMTALAIEGNAHFRVSDFEIKNNLVYTIDTLRALKKAFPHKFFLIIGEDSFEQLPTWKSYMELIEEFPVIVIKRKWTEEKIPQWFRETGKELKILKEGEIICGEGVFFLSCATLPISSSSIREKISMGLSIKYLVPEKVIKYLEKEVLYR